MTRALLVVDVQNGFCRPEGSLSRAGRALAGVEAAVANAAIAVRSARETGTPVVFTRHAYRPGRADEGPRLHHDGALAALDGLLLGTWDAEIVDDLGWTPADFTVHKCRFDAFLWTSLDRLLRGLGVDELVVCGVVTAICVESTVRAAFMRNYRVTLLADACAATTPRLHQASIEVMEQCGFASVRTVAEHVACPRGVRMTPRTSIR